MRRHIVPFLFLFVVFTPGSDAGNKNKKKGDPPPAKAPAPATSGWMFRDVGGGGNVSALMVGPTSRGKDGSFINVAGDLLVGSDMSGVYARPAGKTEFVARYDGLIFTKLIDGVISARGSSTHVPGLDIASAPANLVIAATTGGVIYRSEDRGAHWRAVYDSTQQRDAALFHADSDKIAFGSVAISLGTDAGPRTVVVGVGEPKQLKRGKEKSSGKRKEKRSASGSEAGGVLDKLPKEFAYKVLLSEDSGQTWQKVDLCKNDCPSGKEDVGHVISVAATLDKSKFWVATIGALFLLEKKPGGWSARNQSIGAPKRPQSWKVLSVQPNPKNDSDVLVLTAGDSPRGLLWQSQNANDANVQWKNVSAGFGDKLPRAGMYGPFARMLRSRSRPSEVVLMGTKNDDNGVWFSRDFSTASWAQVLSNKNVPQFAADAWTRFDLTNPQRFKGTSEVAISEDANGIREIFTAGFAGMIVRSERLGDGSDFRSQQIYARQVGSRTEPRYTGNGQISLGSSKGGTIVDSAGGSLAAFLYGDNGFFLTDDRGASFSRPVKSWLFGTGGMIYGQRVVISFSRGNHLESSTEGGVYYSADGGRSFKELDTKGLKKSVFTAAFLSREGSELFGLVPGEGIFQSSPGSSWQAYGQGLPGGGRDVEFLREGMLGKTQLLLAGVSSKKGTELFVRTPSAKGSWQKAGDLKEVREVRFVDGQILVLGEDHILVGMFSEKGPSIRFDAPIEAPRSGNASVHVADITMCRQSIYAATAQGVWKYSLETKTWSATAPIIYKPFWRIAADASCGVYAGADSAGFYYAAAP